MDASFYSMAIDPGLTDNLGKADRISMSGDTPKSPEALKRVCQEMESLFINQLLKQMRRTIPKDGLFGKSNAEDMFTAMHDTELSRVVAGGGGIGLARMLMAQLAHKASAAPEASDSDAAPSLKVSPGVTDNATEGPVQDVADTVSSALPHGADALHHRRGAPWK